MINSPLVLIMGILRMTQIGVALFLPGEVKGSLTLVIKDGKDIYGRGWYDIYVIRGSLIDEYVISIFFIFTRISF